MHIKLHLNDAKFLGNFFFQNNLEAYKLQNKFLNNEILDLFQIKKKDEEKIKELETMVIKSKQ